MNNDTRACEAALNRRLLAGDILGAFEEFYADDVIMQENSAPPTAGKAANREREQAFVASVEAVHGLKLLASAAESDVSLSEWEYDLTFQGGFRTLMAQTAVRRWKNGQVVSERFYYQKG